MKRVVSFLEPAIVLNKNEFRESDLIVSLLGQKKGRLSAIVKGARRSKKRFMGGIDIFDCGVFELTKSSKSSLFTIKNITRRKIFPSLSKDLMKLTSASACLELASNFTIEGEIESKKIFNSLYYAIYEIDKTNKENLKKLLIEFLKLAIFIINYSGFNPSNKLNFKNINKLEDKDYLNNIKEEELINYIKLILPFIEEITEKKLKTKSNLLFLIDTYESISRDF